VIDWKQPWEAGCRCDRLRMTINAPPLMRLLEDYARGTTPASRGPA